MTAQCGGFVGGVSRSGRKLPGVLAKSHVFVPRLLNSKASCSPCARENQCAANHRQTATASAHYVRVGRNKGVVSCARQVAGLRVSSAAATWIKSATCRYWTRCEG